MSGSEFLKNLKNAVENEDFNSEAAKKINEISELAESKVLRSDSNKSYVDTKNLDKIIDDNKDNAKKVSEKEAEELNSKYEEEMAAIKEVDTINSQLATLIEIEDLVKSSIDDMIAHTKTIEGAFKEKLNTELYVDLKNKILSINNKYKDLT